MKKLIDLFFGGRKKSRVPKKKPKSKFAQEQQRLQFRAELAKRGRKFWDCGIAPINGVNGNIVGYTKGISYRSAQGKRTRRPAEKFRRKIRLAAVKAGGVA